MKGKESDYMRNKIDSRIPRYPKLIMPTFLALKALGNSGSNDEILDQVIKSLNISYEVADIIHEGKANQTELSYQLAWARTYLSKYGVIQNSARSVWSITSDFVKVEVLDEKEIISTIVKKNAKGRIKPNDEPPVSLEGETPPIIDDEPDEIKPWKEKLSDILQ